MSLDHLGQAQLLGAPIARAQASKRLRARASSSNIDPSDRLRNLASSHHCCVLISGTLSPVESFREYYFGETPVLSCSLPNVFPKKNRLVLCAEDITSSYSMRQNRENTARIANYIATFSRLRGNLAVYFPSYQILETYARVLEDRLSRRNLIIEPKDSRDAGELLKTFLALPSKGSSGILFAVCGGKWSEGLDYRGEFLAGAMVIGLPLAPYNRVRGRSRGSPPDRTITGSA